MKVHPVDIYDKDGNLLRIEFLDLVDNFIFQAQWDERDEQTSENRAEFRKWAYSMAKNLGYSL